MEKFITAMFAILFVLICIFVGALLSGTILWLIYPHIHALFPSAASNGIITEHLAWWDAVCITWIFGTLIKANYIHQSKD